MKRLLWLTLFLASVAGILLAPSNPSSGGSQPNRRIESRWIFESQEIPPKGIDGAVVASSPLDCEQTTDQAIFYTIESASGTPDLAIAIQVSPDGSTWYLPTMGNTVTASIGAGRRFSYIGAPVSAYQRVVLSNNSDSVTATASVLYQAQ